MAANLDNDTSSSETQTEEMKQEPASSPDPPNHYFKERDRIESFRKMQNSLTSAGLPLASALAKSGFYFDSTTNQICCQFCLLEVAVDRWPLGQSAAEFHRETNSTCNHVNGLYTGNIPVQDTTDGAIQHKQAANQAVDMNIQMDQTPVHLNYKPKSNRLFSFVGKYPDIPGLQLTAVELAESGFFLIKLENGTLFLLCYQCGAHITLTPSLLNLSARELHSHLGSTECPLLQYQQSGNVTTVPQTAVPEWVGDLGPEVNIEIPRTISIETGQIEIETQTNLSQPRDVTRFRDARLRLESFLSTRFWRNLGVPFLKAMVHSGLYYTGAGDAVQCYRCKVVIYGWSLTSERPKIRHCIASPLCKNVTDVMSSATSDAHREKSNALKHHAKFQRRRQFCRPKVVVLNRQQIYSDHQRSGHFHPGQSRIYQDNVMEN